MNRLPNNIYSTSNTCSTEKLACPLCGKPNSCALAIDSSTPSINANCEKPCWCMKQKIDLSVLANIPDHLRNSSCICPECAGVKIDNI